MSLKPVNSSIPKGLNRVGTQTLKAKFDSQFRMYHNLVAAYRRVSSELLDFRTIELVAL